MDALPNAAAFPRHITSMTDGPIRDGDDQDELPLEQQPIFTEQDEQRELATLTIQELTKLQSDLTGIQAITNGFSGLGLGGDTGGINVYSGESTVGSGPSSPAPTSMNNRLLLAALDQHMMTLPAQSTAAYFRATAKCPDEVSNERKLLFLECDENNIPLAAQRLALYWQYRLDGFGEERCFEPMTLAGAMRDEVVTMVKSGIFQLMPNTDASGRAIIYTRMDRRDFSQFSAKQEVAWLTYLLEIVVQHQSLQSRGFVCLFNASNVTRKHYTRQAQQYRQRALDYAFPIRHRSNHGCNLSPLANYILVPVAMRLKSKNMRLRSRVHRGSGEDLLRSLAEFSLPRDRVPSDLGGGVVLDINQFLIDRISLEARKSGINFQALETDNVDQADRAGSTLSSAAPNHNEHGQAPPIDVPSAGVGRATAAASRATETSPKRKRAGNGVDPRMAKAVRAKQEDPDLKLYDALIIGGYVFTQKAPRQTDFDVFDEDGVSLKQRKNNLCTRLKREQTRNETKKASEPVGDGTTSVTQNQAPAAMARRDSFDEQIESLPGLDGLDDWVGRL
mmetsp:Transcript_4250/g.10123  ORF Transcript_4250/g.10123 Transcript_4250/m.10123 type:complete len:562 (+) Transcript_4250:83-1768(+)